MSVKYFSSDIIRQLRRRFWRLYGEVGDRCVDRLAMMVGRYGVGLEPEAPAAVVSQRDAVLITYGDIIRAYGERPLLTLRRFLRKRLRGAVNTVHLLPFFPYSSDDGFSVIDHRVVNPDLGTWDDIEAIGRDFHLMVDLVLNHVSRRSPWFEDYTNGISPCRDYFIEVDPATDLSAVVRPRAQPLLRQVHTPFGDRCLWATFSEDQIDLDFRNPDVLFEILDIIFFYISKGARVLRFNAIAYLWKKVGTPCIHLPETHEIVRLLRDVCAMVAPHVLLLTETNVPHEESETYFGRGDEAHMVYQFTLPPLLLHALDRGDARYLTAWASSLTTPPPGCCFLNFTASHDGIGVRPLEGILPQQEIDELIDRIRGRGGLLSTRIGPDGTESPYELNITYFDAFADPNQRKTELHVARYLCSQTLAMSLAGVPAVYFHSLVASENDYGAVRRTGRPRAINRAKLDAAVLEAALGNKSTLAARILQNYTRLLRLRSRHPAFHPLGAQRILDLGSDLFACVRTAPDQSETVLVLSNVTPHSVAVSSESLGPDLSECQQWKDCIRGRTYNGHRRKLTLHPYQTLWLIPRSR